MKAIKCFYWKGKYYNVGDDAPEDVPKSLVGKAKDVPKQKKLRTYSTKNAAPKESEDKGQKKTD